MSEPPDPRRLAVALSYKAPGAPRVTAKGSGLTADRIVATAREAGVMIEENPVLAEALSKIELDDEVPESLYRATAEVIRFVLMSTGKIPRK